MVRRVWEPSFRSTGVQVRTWPLGAVPLDGVSTAAIEGTTDQYGSRRWLIALPKPQPSMQWRAGHSTEP